MRAAHYIVAAALAVLAGTVGCDTVEPVDSSQLVVEGFLDAGEPLPDIRLRRTLPPGRAYSDAAAAVTDGSLRLEIGGETIHYANDENRPGTYIPALPDFEASAGQPYTVRIRWEGSEIEAEGIVPPEIQLRDVEVRVPDEPVSAVLLDSLSLSDSLATGAYTGYIYPIEVVVHWDDAQPDPGTSWVRLQLKPYAPFSSPVVDLFLNPDEILPEDEQAVEASGARSWTGVYAVGVPDADAPLPDHQLRIAIVRSGEDYARFAASRTAPERREPISNLRGATGILTAISVDSLHVRVGQAAP